jgi:two-component system, OmpR family, response regulator AdeR
MTETLKATSLILVVEDDDDIAESLELFLRRENYRTEKANTGEKALKLFRAAKPDLVLLDVGLPGIDGLEVLRAIRAESRTPVMMLTARSQDIDELLGFGLGADDYITKPFNVQKLMARIKAVLRRRYDGEQQDVLRLGALEVDLYSVRALVHGKDLHLTPTEFKLLSHLASAPGKAMTRNELFEAAMPDSDALERAVDVHLKNVRHKLAEHHAEELLETVRGVGYRLSESET